MLRAPTRLFVSKRSFFCVSRVLGKDLGESQINPSVSSLTENGDEELVVKIAPIERHNEDIHKKRARLVYQSRKRGILETDLLLSRFSQKYLKSFTLAELDEYDKLLDELDWDIYYWATRNYKVTPLPDKWKDSKILKLLQDFSENKEKVIMKMPSLY